MCVSKVGVVIIQKWKYKEPGMELVHKCVL